MVEYVGVCSKTETDPPDYATEQTVFYTDLYMVARLPHAVAQHRPQVPIPETPPGAVSAPAPHAGVAKVIKLGSGSDRDPEIQKLIDLQVIGP